MNANNNSINDYINERESLVAAFCVSSNMPFVASAPETANDRIRIFDTEELFYEFANIYKEKKLLLRGVKIAKKDYMNFFSTLLLTGIDEIVFVSETGERIEPLDALVKQPDFSKVKPEQRPVMNPGLQLVGMYFSQESGRQVPVEEKLGLRELKEELMVNMTRARYLIPVELLDGPGTPQEKLNQGKFKTPVLRLEDDKSFQPIFTDQFELQKYAKGQKLLTVSIPFAALTPFLHKDSTGFLLNPAGVKLIMRREFVTSGKAR